MYTQSMGIMSSIKSRAISSVSRDPIKYTKEYRSWNRFTSLKIKAQLPFNHIKSFAPYTTVSNPSVRGQAGLCMDKKMLEM